MEEDNQNIKTTPENKDLQKTLENEEKSLEKIEMDSMKTKNATNEKTEIENCEEKDMGMANVEATKPNSEVKSDCGNGNKIEITNIDIINVLPTAASKVTAAIVDDNTKASGVDVISSMIPAVTGAAENHLATAIEIDSEQGRITDSNSTQSEKAVEDGRATTVMEEDSELSPNKALNDATIETPKICPALVVGNSSDIAVASIKSAKTRKPASSALSLLAQYDSDDSNPEDSDATSSDDESSNSDDDMDRKKANGPAANPKPPVNVPTTNKENYRNQSKALDSESDSDSDTSSDAATSGSDSDDRLAYLVKIRKALDKAENGENEEEEDCDGSGAGIDEDPADKKKKRQPPRVKGELLLEELPPIQDLHISVPEEECIELGRVHSIVDQLVLVNALPNSVLLDLDTVLFLEKGHNVLGEVFDVLGQVADPLYCVRFNSNKQISEKGISVGDVVYVAPKTQYTQFVILTSLVKLRGSDASWENDIEPPPRYLDYSDDEQEREARMQLRKKDNRPSSVASSDDVMKRARADSSSNSESPSIEHRKHIRPRPTDRSYRPRFVGRYNRAPPPPQSHPPNYNGGSWHSNYYQNYGFGHFAPPNYGVVPLNFNHMNPAMSPFNAYGPVAQQHLFSTPPPLPPHPPPQQQHPGAPGPMYVVNPYAIQPPALHAPQMPPPSMYATPMSPQQQQSPPPPPAEGHN